jgi:5'-methylthioadenosine phosphorylase
MAMRNAPLGAIIGGSGVYQLAGGEFAEQVVETPYGAVTLFQGRGENAGIIFLPRHGVHHQYPPHRVNYRANLKALAMLGVRRVLATSAVGALNGRVAPGKLALLTQFLDFTKGRPSTYYEGEAAGVAHVDVTQPYCPDLGQALCAAARRRGLEWEDSAVYACMEGPRFETAAEVRYLIQCGADVVGMTGVPEAPLARELGLCYASVAVPMNWGAGLVPAGLDLSSSSRLLAEGTQAAVAVCLDVLRAERVAPCSCATSLLILHPPAAEGR